MIQFFKGLVIGFSVAAPVGPIGLLCIRRSIAHGRTVGFVSGLGAATADAVGGVIAALGITAVIAVFTAHRGALQVGGGLFLGYLGIAMMRARPPAEAARAQKATSLWSAYLSTFVLTLMNPMTILSFLGIFAGAGIAAAKDWAEGLAMVGGVFCGSTLWWMILSALASALGARLEGRGLRLVNVAAGIVILGFGLWQLGVSLAGR